MARNKSIPGLLPTVMLLAAAIFLVGLNRQPVPTVDGAVYSSVAREIVRTGQWFPMQYQGRLYTEHPPFYVWSIAASLKLFGINDFAANLPMHFFAFLTVLMTALIARRAGLSRGVALAAALTLCATRDFVFSSIRGYIEPLLEFWIYLALYCALSQFSRRSVFWSFATAICVALAWFAKGPPALWPTVFFPLLFLWKKSSARDKVARLTVYTLTLVTFAVFTVFLVQRFDEAGSFNLYLHKQVLSSALTGRDGAQIFDPFYFARILKDYYLPWVYLLPLVLWAAIHEIRGAVKPKRQIPGLDMPAEALFPKPLPTWIFLVFGLGFVGGFSLVKWKFWYYIAPAYPAFALAIAAGVYQKAAGVFERPFFFKGVSRISLLWILVIAITPFRTWKDRVPEVTAFHPLIAQSQVLGPVYFLHNSRDHNLIVTSGNWYFDREVKKIAALSDVPTQTKSWLIVSKDFWTTNCSAKQCKEHELVFSAPESYLVLLNKNN